MTAPIVITVAGVLLTHDPLTPQGPPSTEAVKILAEATPVLSSSQVVTFPHQVAPDGDGDYARTGDSVPLTSCNLVINCQRILGDIAPREGHARSR